MRRWLVHMRARCPNKYAMGRWRSGHAPAPTRGRTETPSLFDAATHRIHSMCDGGSRESGARARPEPQLGHRASTRTRRDCGEDVIFATPHSWEEKVGNVGTRRPDRVGRLRRGPARPPDYKRRELAPSCCVVREEQ